MNSNNDFLVAVIGISGRFPGAKSVKEFWNNLVYEKESITFFSDEELLEAKIDQKLIDNPFYVKARGIIGDPEYFDASFFGYSPREAETLDPQHRVFLECAWHALEDAGYDPFRVAEKVGVFGGTGVPWYHLEIGKNPYLENFVNGMSVIIGNEKDYLTTRISYKLNLVGTSISVQSACSTSLSAIVLGMQSLLTHQNDMILAGGVSIAFPEKQGYLYEKGSLDSSDGHCRTFDARAEGTIFSSGAGVVLLKRLSDAIRDRDNIYCVIKGGSINNDGISKVSYTSPSIDGQVAVEVDALEMAGVNPETITYVEAHGTATQIGDPIEITALTQAFQQYTSKSNFCAIGSIKTNIGHTDVASGVIGLIKVALSMKNQLIPASLHFETPNPKIDFDNSPFYVNVQTQRWQTEKATPRRALINSFGVGGTNACVILEEAPIINSNISQRPYFFLPLSAKTNTALNEMSSNILEYIHDNPEINLADLSYTLQIGRSLFEHRKAILFSNKNELIDRLSGVSNEGVLSIVSADKEQDLIFMFPGQGNQYIGMGRELYEKEPFFKKEVDYCCDFLKANEDYKYDLKKILISIDKSVDYKKLINQTIIAQPALFIIEFALAKLLIHLGVYPKAMIGHSIGEFVAACISEVLSIEDALSIVVARGSMTQRLPKGSMLAIFSESKTIAEWIKYPNEIAVINSPKLTIVSGPAKAILALEKELCGINISCKKLNTSHGFHSHMMDELIEPLKKIISNVKLHPPRIPIMSTVTGKWMTQKEAQDPNYWAQHARNPVHFSVAAQKLLSESKNLYLEVGPGHSLESAMKNCSDSKNNKIIGIMKPENSSNTENGSLNLALGKIWALGGKVFDGLYQDKKRKRIALPGYPFERQKYLLDFRKTNSESKENNSIKKEDISDWFYVPSWKKTCSLDEVFESKIQNESDSWVLFNNGDDFSRRLIEKLKNSNQMVYSVQFGDSYKEESPSHYFIDPTNLEDYFKLIGKINEEMMGSFRILHLWNWQQGYEDCLDSNYLDSIENKTFYGLLFLEQALIKFNLLDRLHISFVANNIYNVFNDHIDPSKSLIIGPCRVFKNEYPHVQSRLIDIYFPKSEDEIEKSIKLLISENLCSTDEIVVAYRNFSRWIPIYEPIHTPPNENLKRRSFAEHGSYILTGGMGGIGLCLAKFIAENVHANIFLIQRTPFLAKSEWELWLENHQEHDITSKKIEALQEIEALGSSVHVIKGDVSSYSSMKKAISEVLFISPKINGVLHCAGVPGEGIISLKSPEKAAEVLKPKIRGTLILEKLLKNQILDFFISFSSVTGILGEQGQVDYCSANAFLDAFAHSRNSSKSGVYSSINWNAWDIIGMAVENNSKDRLFHHELESNKLNSKYSKRLRPLSSSNGEEHYQILLDSQNDWFISTHRLKGVPILVGTAFLQFLLEYANEKQSEGAIVITNTHFVSPLMFFSNFEKSLKLKVHKKTSSSIFTFFSQSSEMSKDGQNHLHGEVSLREKQINEKINIDQLIEKLSEDPIIRKVHDDDPHAFLWVGTRWKSTKRVFIGEREWLGHFSLPNAYQSETNSFILHPALFDIATSFCIPYIVDDLYLPEGYKKITVLSPIEAEIFSYARLREHSEDMISLDIDLLDKNGKVLVLIEGYALKRISQNGYSPFSKESSSKKTRAILPLEGIDAFKRFFLQYMSPQIIICSEDFNVLIKENQPSIEQSEEQVKEIIIKHSRPQLFTPYVAPTNEIEKTVSSTWEAILGISQLGIDDNFIELGGNSLTAIQIVAQLTELFKIEFSVDSFLSNPTIRTISDFIIDQLIQTLDEEKFNEIMSSKELC